jgi:hypothetical protein
MHHHNQFENICVPEVLFHE